MTTSRRTFLALSGLGAGLALAGCAPAPESAQTAILVRSRRRLPPRFAVPLPVPALARPTRRSADTDYYDIAQRRASVRILPDVDTPIMGYDGMFPGPTVVSTSGRRTVVTHHNELDVPTVVHLHGGHTPADSDGYPVDLVLPRGAQPHGGHHHTGMSGDVRTGSRTHVYPMRQRAATLWYHDHTMDRTAVQVYHGLAGFHLVHDDEEADLPLPTGDRDLPLMLTDRAFEADGRFRYPLGPDGNHVSSQYMSGVMGDVVLVNGAPWPQHEVTASQYRLRLLNASNARRYDLSLQTAAGRRINFVQIGSDGGLLDAPVSHRNLAIAPAERFDVIVDLRGLRSGTEVTMRNASGAGPTRDVMRFRVTGAGEQDEPLPRTLSRVEVPDVPRDAPLREWSFTRGDVDGHSGWTINGRPFDPERMDATPRLGQVERWRFHTDLHHPVHVHLDPFIVRSRGGGSTPGRFDHGWKDTIDLRPAEQAEVIVRFTEHTGKYLLHCHNLEHEDMAMMAAFATR